MLEISPKEPEIVPDEVILEANAIDPTKEAPDITPNAVKAAAMLVINDRLGDVISPVPSKVADKSLPRAREPKVKEPTPFIVVVELKRPPLSPIINE